MANPTEYRQSYQSQPVATSTGAPKEIGILTRIEGVRSGMEEVRMRLNGFVNRIQGNCPAPTSNVAQDRSLALPAVIADVEEEIRACLQSLQALNDAF